MFKPFLQHVRLRSLASMPSTRGRLSVSTRSSAPDTKEETVIFPVSPPKNSTRIGILTQHWLHGLSCRCQGHGQPSGQKGCLSLLKGLILCYHFRSGTNHWIHFSTELISTTQHMLSLTPSLRKFRRQQAVEAQVILRPNAIILALEFTQWSVLQCFQQIATF